MIAIDGNTLRRSYQEAGDRVPIHLISAWSCGHNPLLGQAKASAKSNESTAIPKLLDLLAINGATITIDAIVRSMAFGLGSCLREIATEIIEKAAHTVLVLKGNQGT